MIYYSDEPSARTDIVTVVTPFIKTAEVFVVERRAVNVGLRETVFAIRIKPGDTKSEPLCNALMNYQVQTGKALEFDGSKLDMVGDIPNEYILAKATINVLPFVDIE